MTKQPSVETKIYDILDEINPKIAECVCGNHWTLHRGSNLHKATEQILVLFSTQQAQISKTEAIRTNELMEINEELARKLNKTQDKVLYYQEQQAQMRDKISDLYEENGEDPISLDAVLNILGEEEK